MKKILALLLACILVFSLCACGSSSSAEPEEQPAEEPAEEPVEEEVLSEADAAKLSVWTDDLYEPETTITYPATIVWPADATAVETASKDVRPNTMLVELDANLFVYTAEGEELGRLGAYLASVKGGTLPALYIKDDETAAAFNAFAAKYSVADVFVVADHEHTDYVRDICDANLGVLGIIDWRGAGLSTDRADLLTIIQGTNAAHAKVAIIPEELADYDSVEYIRSMLITVWAETSPEPEAIYTQITNGVNGIFCSDYNAVAEALCSVNDVTTLMRHVYITGHRGLPSQYVENTIRSERAAIEAGANVIECDVSISSDGEIFVLHDDTLGRLFNDPDDTWAESLTMAELQALEYDMTDDTKENAPNSVLNANNTNRNNERRENMTINYDPAEDHIPTLREYLTALGDDDIIQFIEIKSYQPAIVAPLKALVEEMGMEDRVCVITFNDGIAHFSDGTKDPSKDVISEMRKTWPEMSCGYLGIGPKFWGPLDEIAAEKGMGTAVGTLYSWLKPNNCTCNDYNAYMFRDVVFAARHRGLTAWCWTYNTEEMFAQDYLFGGSYSLTTNFTTWATDLPVKIEADDMEAADGDAINCKVIAQDGRELDMTDALSLVSVSGVPVSLENGVLSASEAGEAVVMLRLDNKLNVNDFDIESLMDTNYAIYSNPFTITVK